MAAGFESNLYESAVNGRREFGDAYRWEREKNKRLREALGTLERKLSRHSAALREGAGKCPPEHRALYETMADQAESFAEDARAALAKASAALGE